MQTLSATAALSPALARTRLVLFAPFRKARTWKLAATAYLATLSAIFLPFPLFYLSFLPRALHSGGIFAALLVSVVLIFTAFFLLIFILCNRLRFAFFDIVLNRGEFVAPAWSKYGSQSVKWTAVKVVLGLAVTAVLALPTAAYFRQLSTIMATLKPGQPASPQFLLNLFAGYVLIYLGFGTAFFVGSLLSDFIVPSLALENTTLSEAFRRLVQLIHQEPGEVALYALLKLALGIAAYVAVAIVFQITLLLALIVVGILAGIVGFILHLIGVPGPILLALAIFIGVVFYVFFLVYFLLLILGTILTFFEAYTLYFLAGRYPLLGSLLEQSTPLSSIPEPSAMQSPY